MPRPRLLIYKDKKGEWRWTFFAANGRKLANSGEGYKRRATLKRIVNKIFLPWAD